MKFNLTQKHIWIFAVVMVIAMVTLWSLNWYLLKHFLWYPDQYVERGTFGDMFGAVNALFSGFAFVGVAVAIMYQHVELQEVKSSIEFEKEIALSQIRPFFTLKRTSNSIVFVHEIINVGSNIFNAKMEVTRLIDKSSLLGKDDVLSRDIMRKDKADDQFQLIIRRDNYLDKENFEDKFQIKFTYVLVNGIEDSQIWVLKGSSIKFHGSKVLGKGKFLPLM